MRVEVGRGVGAVDPLSDSPAISNHPYFTNMYTIESAN